MTAGGGDGDGVASSFSSQDMPRTPSRDGGGGGGGGGGRGGGVLLGGAAVGRHAAPDGDLQHVALRTRRKQLELMLCRVGACWRCQCIVCLFAYTHTHIHTHISFVDSSKGRYSV